ncbi:MAG: ATP-binding protein, partial [Candidatus Limnocylindria bacterium]
ATPLAADAPAPAAQQAGQPAPVAERRLVSVVFADLVGFTPFSEERDAEEVRATLSRYFDLAAGIVDRYGGTVEKFIGDAVMAVWGTPTAHEDDAERAVRAALELIDGVGALGPGIGARAGVLTGEAAVTLGARNEGMVAGDLVNTAARLQSVAPEGSVLVGEATYRAASMAIAFEEAGPQLLKGKTSPVAAWRALRVVAQRGGQGRSDMPEPPFVGREEELRLLKDALHATGRDRRPRLVTVTGPGGIGKSRLAWEFEKYIDGVVENIYWHRGRCPAYGDGITFWALGEMVRRRAQLAETDDEATTRAGIAAAVAQWVPDPDDRRWVEPALLTLLGLEPAPAGGRDVLFAAWRIFFERIAAQGTTVLLFEDLQWADSGLLDFIDHLLEWSKGVPILVVALARPELADRRADFGSGTRNFTHIALEPLSEAAMRDLLAGLVPGLPGAAIDAILARADGIPLYAVETVRSLVADGRLELVDGIYRPTGDLGQLAIPDTLRSLIASRLDSLDAADRSLVEDAAVLGQAFTLAGLAAVSGNEPAQLEGRLRGLIRRELFELEADPRSPERGQYRFVQSLIREVAYGTLARPERRARHLAVARFFEVLGDDELAGGLASHYLAAYQASAPGAESDAIAIQARLALRGAAERAAQLGAHDQAVTYLRQALEVATEPADRAEILLRAAESADAAASYEVAEGLARQAVTAFETAGDLSGRATADALIGTVLINASQMATAIEVLTSALGELGDDVADEVKAGLLSNLSRALFRNEEAQRAIEVADRALVIAERLNLDEIIAEALINKGSALSYLGRRREAVALMGAALSLSQAGGFIQAELRARNNLATVEFEDAPRLAGEMVRAALELSRRVGIRGMSHFLVFSSAAYGYSEGDDWTGLLTLIDEELAAARTPADESRLLGVSSFVRASRGEPTAEAVSRLEQLDLQVNDSQLAAGLDLARGERGLWEGDLAASHDAFVRAADASTVETYSLPMAARAALWMGDVERARAVAARLEAAPFSGRVAQVELIAVRAGIAALEGREAEAIEGYREALRQRRALELHFDTARTALDYVLLVGPNAPGAREAAEEARAVFERLGARPYLNRLQEALVAAPPQSPTPSQPTPTAVTPA